MRTITIDRVELAKEHRNNVGHSKSITLWFPSQREPLPNEIIETYFDKIDGVYHPITIH